MRTRRTSDVLGRVVASTSRAARRRVPVIRGYRPADGVTPLPIEMGMERHLRKPALIACLRCGKHAQGQRNKRYCSGRCHRLAWAKAQRAAKGLIRPARSRSGGSTVGACIRCGAEFVGHRDKRFCSERCAESVRRPQRREYDRQRARDYRLAHSEELRLRRQEHPQDPEIRRRWVEQNREKSREAYRRHRAKDLEGYRARERARHANDPTKRRASHTAWSKRNPERMAHLQAARRARELNAPGSHTFNEWLELVSQYQGRCAYCGRSDLPLTRDHVVPLSGGGSNGIGNILPACRPCNTRKGRWSRERFDQLRGPSD